jgi:hypothetical protein
MINNMNKTGTLTILGIIFLAFALTFVSAVTITDVSSSPAQAAPGEVVEVSINIENIHTFDIENINVRLDLSESPFAPYQSSSEQFLDELNDGDDEDFDFDIIVLPDTEPGIYKFPVEITYTKMGLISLTVNSQPELRVSLEDSVALIKGKENTISLRIVNSGLANAKFLYVRVNDISGIDVLSENEQYVGDVDSDDFDSIEYNVFIDAGTQNTVSFPVTLKYRDSTNKQFTEVKNVNLRVYSLEEAQRLGIVAKPSYTLFIGIGAVVLIYILYRIRKSYKKRKKMKEGR